MNSVENDHPAPLIFYILFLLIIFFAFICFFLNSSRKISNTLLPRLIIMSCSFQMMVNFCLIVSRNPKTFFDFNPLPAKLSLLYKFVADIELMKPLMKMINALLMVLGICGVYTTEILYCYESIMLFQKPITNTSRRDITYKILISLVLFSSIFIELSTRNKIFEKISKEKSFKSVVIETVNELFGNNYHNVLLQIIFPYVLILGTIYMIAAYISFFILNNRLKVKSILFQTEKDLFKIRHFLYTGFGVGFTLLCLFIYIYVTETFGLIDFKIKSGSQIWVDHFIPFNLNLFGTSNCLLKLMEIDISVIISNFNLVGNTSNDKDKKYNIKAIRELRDLVKEKNVDNNKEININLNDKGKEQESNKSINDIISNEKDNAMIGLALSSQIAIDFLSESIFYIVSCISTIAKKRIISCVKNKKEWVEPTDGPREIDAYKFSFETVVKGNVEGICKNNDLIGFDKEDKEDKIQEIKWEKDTTNTKLKFLDILGFFRSYISDDIELIYYAPNIFKNIQIIDGITDETIYNSFNVKENILGLSSMKISEGQSGSFFFISHDKKFVLKTISGEEKDNLLSFVYYYYDHFNGNNESLLCRIYGMYTLKMGMSELHVVLMENVFPFDEDDILCKFDLKGIEDKKLTEINYNDRYNSLRDSDYTIICKADERFKIEFSDVDKDAITKMFTYDINFLAEKRLIDYSFLVFIYKKDISDINAQYNLNNMIKKDRFIKAYSSKNKSFKDKENIYYTICIVDYLVRSNTINNLKSKFNYLLCKNELVKISPDKYKSRLSKFLIDNDIISEFDYDSFPIGE